MKNKILLFFIIVSSIKVSAQVSGLSGWNIFLDPGHSQNENVGIYNYSEAPKVLRVGLNLRDMLLNETDIDTVYISRTNDNQVVDLSQRTDYANSVAAAWYHSIHSDAAGNTTSNSTLLLWGQYGNQIEKIPNGGKAMSSIMVDLLTRGYRTNTRGSVGDCTFYGDCNAYASSAPHLYINRYTNMPSELSEAGFHTSAFQNPINMNNDWKRLEARTFFWSFLKFKGIARPPVRIVAGHVKDIDNNLFVNGAFVTINNQSKTTDTYESLFHSYTNGSQLRNGFFYFENLPAGTHTLTVSTPEYEDYSTEVTVSDTFFTFVDPLTISSIPPKILSTSLENGDSLYAGFDTLRINFSRPMDKASVESNISVTPSVALTFMWQNNDQNLLIFTQNMAFSTDYVLTLSGNAKGRYEHLFDGNGDNTGGDSYSLNFRTKEMDVTAPGFADLSPSSGAINTSLQPLINITFSEYVSTSTLSGKFKVVKTSDQSLVSGLLKHYYVNGKSVLNLFVRGNLLPFTNYTVQIAPGIKDLFGNEITNPFDFSFTTGDTLTGTLVTHDNFEGTTLNWAQSVPSGIIPNETSIAISTSQYNFLYSGSKGLRLMYSWDTNAANWFLREFYTGASVSLIGPFYLQAYIFGDGEKNKFRFAVKDGGTGGYEVSPWYNVDWRGWKEVKWTPSVDGFGEWVGDGSLQGTVTFDSYQFTYTPGSKSKGTYYFDDARAVNFPSVDVKADEDNKPNRYVLEQNYPNPFNPSTKIRFSTLRSGNVKLEVYNLIGQKVATLVNGELNAGYHNITFDAGNLTSGVYIYKLTTPEFTASKKLILIK